MSLLLSPILLFFMGLLVARISKARWVWRRHSLFTLKVGGVVLVVYTLFMLGLFVDQGAFAWLVHLLPAESGMDWVVNSGVFGWDAAWPLADPRVVAWIILGFMAFPLWMYLGVMTAYWLFGRNPRQPGILGLLH